MVVVDRILNLKIGFIQSFGVLFVFLATFLESFPLIGIFIPGSIIIFLAGFFAKLGWLNIWVVLAFAVFGAIGGSLMGYVFGKYLGKEFLYKYQRLVPLSLEYIDKSITLVRKHLGKALILGRISPVTRTAAPFIAGAYNVNFGKFMFFNVVGGSLWGFFFVALGYVFGKSYRLADKIDRWLILLTIILVLGFYIYYVTKKLTTKMKNRGVR